MLYRFESKGYLISGQELRSEFQFVPQQEGNPHLVIDQRSFLLYPWLKFLLLQSSEGSWNDLHARRRLVR